MAVIGLYTCDCHLFKDYDEANKFKNQKLPIGTEVKNRCTNRKGIIESFCNQKGYVIVKYGSLQSDKHLEHVQELIKIKLET